MQIPMRSRYRGVLLGLATGDALGTTLEFKPPSTFAPITDMVGGGPFGLAPGQWTDDTSMALCLAESLVDCQGFNPRDQMDRYVRWWREGYRSSTGTCFDIGGTVRSALHRYHDTGEPYSGSDDPHSAGNGSLMRLGPIHLAYRADPALAPAIAPTPSPRARCWQPIWGWTPTPTPPSTASWPGPVTGRRGSHGAGAPASLICC